ncbi:hypothetical protein, partial [Akkermansia sp.]|uniref:hypothetical protein n=1 Tax=Akkermansia sp. TaxID=1872421 RepID=UPI003AB58E6A
MKNQVPFSWFSVFTVVALFKRLKADIPEGIWNCAKVGRFPLLRLLFLSCVKKYLLYVDITIFK